jgi:hypothetical protein
LAKTFNGSDQSIVDSHPGLWNVRSLILSAELLGDTEEKATPILGRAGDHDPLSGRRECDLAWKAELTGATC